MMSKANLFKLGLILVLASIGHVNSLSVSPVVQPGCGAPKSIETSASQQVPQPQGGGGCGSGGGGCGGGGGGCGGGCCGK